MLNNGGVDTEIETNWMFFTQSRIEGFLEKMKLNDPGRQKLAGHSMHSYTLTHYRLRKREPLISLGSHQGGPYFLHPRYPTAGWGQI